MPNMTSIKLTAFETSQEEQQVCQNDNNHHHRLGVHHQDRVLLGLITSTIISDDALSEE